MVSVIRCRDAVQCMISLAEPELTNRIITVEFLFTIILLFTAYIKKAI